MKHFSLWYRKQDEHVCLTVRGDIASRV